MCKKILYFLITHSPHKTASEVLVQGPPDSAADEVAVIMRGKNLIEQCSKKCPNLSVAQFFHPQRWKDIINLTKIELKEIVSRNQNLWNSFCRQMRTEKKKKKNWSGNASQVKGDVGGNGDETLPVTQWSVFGIWCEGGRCQIVKYKYLTSTNRWQPFDDHWGTSVASELNLWDNFQQPMGGRSLYSLMVGRNFDGPPI